MFERTADTPWCAVPLLDSDKKPTLWFKSDIEAHDFADGNAYDVQYRPRRRRVKQKAVRLTEK